MDIQTYPMSPELKDTPVEGNQRFPDMKPPTVNACAWVDVSDAWYPPHLTLPEVDAPDPEFMYSP